MQSLAPAVRPDQTAAPRAALERPFYFIVVLWGERFRSFLLDFALPTLLSPNNLLALNTSPRSKFLICTRPEDWSVIERASVFQLLNKYVEPVYVEIPPCPAGVPGGIHMGTGHRLGYGFAHAAQAYAFVLMPDCVFSDGMIARLQDLAREGIELVMIPALRFAQEPLFEQLRKAGISPADHHKGAAAPICLQSRDLVRMALKSMHSESASYEWNAGYFHPIPSAVWWRVPGEDGIVLHSLSWAPMIDFAAVHEHDASTFDYWTFDGDYAYKNLGNISRVHLVLDSDEMFMASWSRSAENPYDLTPRKELGWPLVGGLVKRHRFRQAFYGGDLRLDPLRQTMLFHGARWHAEPVDQAWLPVEQRAVRALYSCVAPPADERIAVVLPPRKDMPTLVPLVRGLVSLMCAIGVAILRVRDVLRHFWIHREAFLPRMRQVLHGDPDVIRWLIWRARELAYYLAGRTAPGKPPRPNR
jgi:hypothetical protein